MWALRSWSRTLVLPPFVLNKRDLAVSEALCLFLSRWTFGPPRGSARPPRRSAGSTRWATRSTRWSFGPTGRAFRPPIGGFFVGRLCRLLIGCSRLLLRPTVRTEVGGLLGKLRTALRTEVAPFVGEFRAAVRAEVGGFVGELHAAVRTKPLFFGTLLGQCGLPSPSP